MLCYCGKTALYRVDTVGFCKDHYAEASMASLAQTNMIIAKSRHRFADRMKAAVNDDLATRGGATSYAYKRAVRELKSGRGSMKPLNLISTRDRHDA